MIRITAPNLAELAPGSVRFSYIFRFTKNSFKKSGFEKRADDLSYDTITPHFALSCLRRSTFQGWKVPKDPRGDCLGPRFSMASCFLLLIGMVILSN